MFISRFSFISRWWIFIVTGLPINQYKEQKDKLKNFFLLQNNKGVSINDKTEKIIRINDVLVYPQGVGAFIVKTFKEI